MPEISQLLFAIVSLLMIGMGLLLAVDILLQPLLVLSRISAPRDWTTVVEKLVENYAARQGNIWLERCRLPDYNPSHLRAELIGGPNRKLAMFYSLMVLGVALGYAIAFLSMAIAGLMIALYFVKLIQLPGILASLFSSGEVFGGCVLIAFFLILLSIPGQIAMKGLAKKWKEV